MWPFRPIQTCIHCAFLFICLFCLYLFCLFCFSTYCILILYVFVNQIIFKGTKITLLVTILVVLPCFAPRESSKSKWWTREVCFVFLFRNKMTSWNPLLTTLSKGMKFMSNTFCILIYSVEKGKNIIRWGKCVHTYVPSTKILQEFKAVLGTLRAFVHLTCQQGSTYHFRQNIKIKDFIFCLLFLFKMSGFSNYF